MSFSSKDFSKTPSELTVKMPERLIHRNVEEKDSTQTDNSFSAERGHGVAIVDLPTKTISMTIGHLQQGQSTRTHRHNYETVLYIIEGKGYSELGGEVVEWQQGDAVYVPIWSWHRHVNTSEGEVRLATRHTCRAFVASCKSITSLRAAVLDLLAYNEVLNGPTCARRFATNRCIVCSAYEKESFNKRSHLGNASALGV